MELARLHEGVHAGKRLAGLGKDHYAAHWAVQSVDYTAENVAGLVVALLEIDFYLVTERGVACFVALHYLSRPFVEGYEVVVLIDYLVRQVEGHWLTVF